jgi:hypothetical protein
MVHTRSCVAMSDKDNVVALHDNHFFIVKGDKTPCIAQLPNRHQRSMDAGEEVRFPGFFR